MTLQVPISSEAEAKLRERALASGQDLSSYVAHLLDESLTRPSLDEILAPIRQTVDQSGMSEDELSDLLEKAKHDVRRERRRVAP